MTYRIQHRRYTFDKSLTTNPYFYYAPFAGIAVANAAHTFVRKLLRSSFPLFDHPSHLPISLSGLDVQPFYRPSQRYPRS